MSFKRSAALRVRLNETEFHSSSFAVQQTERLAAADALRYYYLCDFYASDVKSIDIVFKNFNGRGNS